MKSVLLIFGTRPEGIKLASLINKLKQRDDLRTITCITSQHKRLLHQVVEYFKIPIDYNLDVMIENQTLDYITQMTIAKLERIFDDVHPDLTVVQGDATSSLVGAISSFYHKVPVAHIEAGLRTNDKNYPFPEEINRRLITQIANFHFAPTKKSVENLLSEHIPKEQIFLVGNTTIDAQLSTLKYLSEKEDFYNSMFKNINFEKKILLVTCHRRENFGKPFEEICNTLMHLAKKFNDIEIVFPVHLNPNIRKVAFSLLKSSKIHLLEPLDYPALLFLMKKSYLILTDSGGLQEEAPTLGKPVLVLREKTERVESVELGISKVVGTKRENIINWTEKLLLEQESYEQMAKVCFPYGDGTASDKIYNKILELLL